MNVSIEDTVGIRSFPTLKLLGLHDKYKEKSKCVSL